MDLIRRINIPELMDTADLDSAELHSALRFISMTNRYFGGNRILLGYLRHWSRQWPKGQALTFLDVGTGNADIPIAIVRWARTQGFDVRVKAIDSTPRIAEIAKQNARDYPEIEVVEANFFSLASSGAAFDYVLVSLFLHHLPDDRLLEALKLCDRLARRGVLINDLLRSQQAYYVVKAVTFLFGNRIVQKDGPLSVRRAFLPSELDDLAHKAGLNYLHARPHSFYHLTLAGQKDDQNA